MAAKKKEYVALLPKGTREEVRRIMEERQGSRTFAEHVARSWDLNELLQPTTYRTVEQLQARLDEGRLSLANKRPDWTPEQVDDVIRLHQLASPLQEMGIARRCALDAPEELARFLTARNRLRLAGIEDMADNLLEPCVTGELAIARQLAARKPLGNNAVVQERDLHELAWHALLLNDSASFQWLVEQLSIVNWKQVRPWRAGLLKVMEGIAARDAAQIAQGLNTHIEGLHKMQQRRELEGAVKLEAHALVRLLAADSPELIAQFNVEQAFPWDAPLHAWVDAHPDPVADWDLSGLPPLVQQIIGKGEVPPWLQSHVAWQEMVLLGGDPQSRSLLERIEWLIGGNDGTVRRAKELLQRCPVLLRWGLEADVAEQFAKHCQESIAAGELAIRPMTSTGVRWIEALR